MNKQRNTTGTFSTGTNNFPVNPTLFQNLSRISQITAVALLTLAFAVVIQVTTASVASAYRVTAEEFLLISDTEYDSFVDEEIEPTPVEPVAVDWCSVINQLCIGEDPLIDDGIEVPVLCSPPATDNSYASSCPDYGFDDRREYLLVQPAPWNILWRTVDFASLDAIKDFGNSVCDESIGHLYGIECADYNLPASLRTWDAHDHGFILAEFSPDDEGDDLGYSLGGLYLSDLWFVVDFTSIDSFNHGFVSQRSYMFFDFGFPHYEDSYEDCFYNEQYEEEVCITLG